MKEKLKKTLFEYSNNSRITTKELGKKINSSQQSASYLIKSLKRKKRIIGEAVIVDAVKLGYTNTLVGLNYVKINEADRKEILEVLKKTDEIIGIEESKEGFDLLIEFSTQNLAALDNIHTKIINKYENKLNTAFIFPILTKYKSPRKYLKKSKETKLKVLLGDKTLKEMTTTEERILKELIKNPTEKIINLSEKTKIGIKTVIKSIKELEKRFIIKGYEAILDHEKLGINKEILFLRFPSEGIKEINHFIEYAKSNKNILETIKILGSSQVVVVVESLQEIKIIKEIRTLFPIQSYMIFKSSKVHKRTYLPLEE